MMKMMKMLFIVMMCGASLLGVEKAEKSIAKYAPRLGVNILNKDVNSAKGLAMLRLGGLINPKNDTFLLAMAYLEEGNPPKASEKVNEKKFLSYILKRADGLRKGKSGKDKILALTYYRVLQTFDYEKDKVLLGVMKLKVEGVVGELEDLLNKKIKPPLKPREIALKKKVSDADIVKALGYDLKRHPSGAKKGPSGHYYMYVKNGTDWKTAYAESKKLGGYLATITTKEEFDFVCKLGDPQEGNSQGAIFVGGKVSGGKAISWITKEETGDKVPIRVMHPRYNHLSLRRADNQPMLAGQYGHGCNGSKLRMVKGFIVEWH